MGVNVWDSRYRSQRFSSRGVAGSHGSRADTLAMYYCNCVDNDKKKPGGVGREGLLWVQL